MSKGWDDIGAASVPCAARRNGLNAKNVVWMRINRRLPSPSREFLGRLKSKKNAAIYFSLQFHRIIAYWFCILIIVIVFLRRVVTRRWPFWDLLFIFLHIKKIQTGKWRIFTIFSVWDLRLNKFWDDLFASCVRSDGSIASVYRSVCSPSDGRKKDSG